MAEWFVQNGEKEIGPISVVDLKQMAELGAVDADSLIRRGRDGKWIKATKVQGLPLRIPAPVQEIPAASPAPRPLKQAPAPVPQSPPGAPADGVDDDTIASWLGVEDGKGPKRPPSLEDEPRDPNGDAETGTALAPSSISAPDATLPDATPVPAAAASEIIRKKVQQTKTGERDAANPRAGKQAGPKPASAKLKSLLPNKRLLLAVGFVALGAGSIAFSTWYSGKHGKTAEQALEAAFKRNSQLKRRAVAPVSGRVTVDGETPGMERRSKDAPPSAIVVALHPKQREEGAPPFLYTTCDPEGNFAFSTYGNGDGVPIGSYTLTISRLDRVGGRGSFGPPDHLKNLFNDPEMNSQKTDMVVNVESPGRTNYHFDLRIKDKTAIATPGPRAVLRVGTAPGM